jgi:hypothetical protein
MAKVTKKFLWANLFLQKPKGYKTVKPPDGQEAFTNQL